MKVENLSELRLLKFRHYAYATSAVLFVLSIFMWFSRGDEKYGIDFAGGSELFISLEKPAELSVIRSVLGEAGVSGAHIQSFGSSVGKAGAVSDVSIRRKGQLSQTGGDLQVDIKKVLREKVDPNLKVVREEVVGPVVGEKIKRDGAWAAVLSLIAVLLYIAFRFEFRFAVGAVVALIHDGVIATGVFLLVGGEISSSLLAAILTIVGYSLTDTIVIYDRVRENWAILQSGKSKLKGESLFEMTDRSITQTLSRTMLTSVLTFIVVFILWLIGGEGLNDMAFTLSVGVIVGTYSTIFIACPLMVYLASGNSSANRVTAS